MKIVQGNRKIGGTGAVMLLAMLPALLTTALFRAANRIGDSDGGADSGERGDVPGWVMITLMSAVLVAGLLAIAGPALEAMFQNALDQVNKGR